MNRKSGFALLFILFLGMSCENTVNQENNVFIPQPSQVDNAPDGPDTDVRYYKIGNIDNAADLFADVLRGGVSLDRAWVPAEGDLCVIPNSEEVIIVLTTSADSRIENYGFQPDLGIIVANCGISKFDYYQF